MSRPASGPANDDDLGDRDDERSESPRQLSSKEGLALGREQGPAEASPADPDPALCPVPPSRRFTWGVRIGIVVAVLIFGGLVVWTRYDAERALSLPAAVLLGLGVLVAVVGLVQAWCWAGRPRFSRSQSEVITAGLPLETKKTVKQMAHGRGRDVPELRARAAAYAWVQQQNTSLSVAGLALINVSNMAQSSGAIVGLVLFVAILLITGGVLGYDLWLGHRRRVLAVHLPTHPNDTHPTAGPT